MSIGQKKITQRALDALKTREKLFRTALNLFSKYGYNKVTVEDITKRAGLSKGSFYTHFQSKEEVLLEQFRMIDAHYEAVFKNVPESASAGERLLLLIKAMCNYCSNVVGISPLQVIYGNQVMFPKSTRILNNQERLVYKILKDICRRGKESSEIPLDCDETFFAEMMIRNARGLIYDWCLYDGSFNLEQEGIQYYTKILYFLQLEAKQQK